MGKVYYNKLIRDNIPDKIKNKGEVCEVRTIFDDEEFAQELLKKVAEEAVALSRVRTKEEFLDELSDLSVVLDELCRIKNISTDDINSAKEENISRKGSFTKRLFLHWSDDSDYKSNETPQGISKNK